MFCFKINYLVYIVFQQNMIIFKSSSSYEISKSFKVTAATVDLNVRP